ncbi:MAG: methyl-accepting chemotaxis protein [Janthinobacterium lividum]
MTITKRLMLVFGLCFFSLLVTAGIGLQAVLAANTRLEYLAKQMLPRVEAIRQIQETQATARTSLLASLFVESAARKQELRKIVGASLDTANAQIVQYEESVSDDAQALMLARDAQQAVGELQQSIQGIYQEVDAHGQQAAQFLLMGTSPVKGALEHLSKSMKAQTAYNRDLAEHLRVESTAAQRRVVIIDTIVILLMLAGVGSFAALTLQYIRNSLARLSKTLHAMSRDLDLTHRVSDIRRDEIGEMGSALNTLIERVHAVLGQVTHSSHAVALASQEISAGNVDLAARTEEQAASLGETASSMEQLTVTVQHNADNARQANILSKDAESVFVNGDAAMTRLMTSIDAISSGSKQIVDITSLIEGIAFQTNILALNAAVEAARAGQEGRGFAVVASEVRELAQRSASASKDIKALIGSSVTTIGQGHEHARDVMARMGDVKMAMSRVTDIVAEISAASDEQSRGIEQVNQAVQQMDEVTQQNAALVEESSATTQSLNDQTTQLDQAVSVFRL